MTKSVCRRVFTLALAILASNAGQLCWSQSTDTSSFTGWFAFGGVGARTRIMTAGTLSAPAGPVLDDLTILFGKINLEHRRQSQDDTLARGQDSTVKTNQDWLVIRYPAVPHDESIDISFSLTFMNGTVRLGSDEGYATFPTKGFGLGMHYDYVPDIDNRIGYTGGIGMEYIWTDIGSESPSGTSASLSKRFVWYPEFQAGAFYNLTGNIFLSLDICCAVLPYTMSIAQTSGNNIRAGTEVSVFPKIGLLIRH